MNKLLKGAIAGAAGVAVLLGGAGTFALWNDSVTTPAGTVSSGTLSIDSGLAAGKWFDMSAGTPGVLITDIEAFRLVPGDKLRFTKVVTINATGDNLSAALTVDLASVVGDDKASSAALQEELSTNMVVTASSVAGVTQSTVPGNENEFIVTAEDLGLTKDVTMSVELTFPVGTLEDIDASNNVTKNGSVNLNNLKFKLTQVRA
ncbi:MAG: hypothetical protein JWL94_1263 [Microbacteriaceae bacterium]|jgi:alternate signal-mediated exported protein|nr:hypothetical protein [Microbacteriaceae bacterium]